MSSPRAASGGSGRVNRPDKPCLDRGQWDAWAMSSSARRGHYSRVDRQREPLGENGVIAVTGNRARADALARLDVFTGEWVMEVRFPGGQPVPFSMAEDGPMARSRFEWAMGRQFLHFRQRFTGTFSEDGNTISGAWEKCVSGADWEHDFALTYRRVISPRGD